MAGACVAAALVVTLLSASARAVERVYWDNANDGTLGVGNLNGTGAGQLATAGVSIELPEGMAYDPVGGRLYVADAGKGGRAGKIAYVDPNGSGGGTFSPPATAPVDKPAGVVIDPVARIAYWLNTGAVSESISWARLDGSEGGEVVTATAPLLGARRLALDPAAGRLYWGNSDGSIEYAAVNGTGGGSFAAETNTVISGLSYYPALERLYWVEENGTEAHSAALAESPSHSVWTGSAPISHPAGLALDPTTVDPQLYWANRAATGPAGAIGFSGIVPGSAAGELALLGAPVNGPQDPIVIKSPVSTAPPVITSTPKLLSCSPGGWEPDYVSSFVYEAPQSLSYQWTLNDTPIEGATGPSYSAPVSGTYKCVVTATNAAGSASRTSRGMVVTITVRRKPPPVSTPAKLVLDGGARKLRAKPGKLLALGVQVSNRGTVASAPAELCLKLTKKAKRALKPGRCAQLGHIAGGATAKAKLRLRVKRHARPGLYKLQIALPGAATEVTVRVLG